MKIFYFPLFFLILSSITVFSSQKEAPWEEVKSGDGITAYLRDSADGGYPELRAITVVDAPMEVVAQIIRDNEARPMWMANCESSEVVEFFDENNMIVHIVMHFPVVQNRDLVVKSDTVYDLEKARGIVNLSFVKDSDVPVPNRVVRMNDFSGTLQFDYITREKTGVTYTYKADPGMRLPARVTNYFAKNLLHDTLSNLKYKMVPMKKYHLMAAESKDRQLFENILKDKNKVRSIIRARMTEHFSDHRSIDKILAHDEVIENFLNGEASRQTEKLFFSMGQPDKLQKIAEESIYLIIETVSGGNFTEKIPQASELAKRFVNGPKKGEKCVYDELESMYGHLLQKK